MLILGGTGEAVRLAQQLAVAVEIDVVTSLAGRTRRPAPVPGEVRVGGFGGVDGLQAYLAEQKFDSVVDATHPYAAQISRHAAQACDALSIPRLQLWRPAWQAVEGDRWTEVENMVAAVEAVGKLMTDKAGTALVTTGHKELHCFRSLTDVHFGIRLVEPPTEPLPLAHYELILSKGPFSEQDEQALFRRFNVSLLISKNSGSAATYAKIRTARELGVPVVMVQRPLPEPGPRAENVESACEWMLGK